MLKVAILWQLAWISVSAFCWWYNVWLQGFAVTGRKLRGEFCIISWKSSPALYWPGSVTRFLKEMRKSKKTSLRSGASQEIWVTVMVDGSWHILPLLQLPILIADTDKETQKRSRPKLKWELPQKLWWWKIIPANIFILLDVLSSCLNLIQDCENWESLLSIGHFDGAEYWLFW